MYKPDILEQKPDELFIKSVAHTELEEADCCSTYPVSWNTYNENIFGFKIATKCGTSPGLPGWMLHLQFLFLHL